jgi:hypothetical protein
LTERESDSTARAAVNHEPRSVTRHPHGGFTLDRRAENEIRVVASQDGWNIEGDPEMQQWNLRRAGSSAGFVLAKGEHEVARTMKPVGMNEATAPKNLLLDDGRLFRIVSLGPRESGVDLLGWETPGAYLRARPAADGWTIEPTLACGGIPDVRALTLLLAAEVLEAEEPLS